MTTNLQEQCQELADKHGFDLKKLPYGFQFRIGKLILNYYNTTGSVVISEPKKSQKVKKRVAFEKIDSMLEKLKGGIKSSKPITGEQAINFIIAGVTVKHKRMGEQEWRTQNIKSLPLDSFLNKTFVFELGE